MLDLPVRPQSFGELYDSVVGVLNATSPEALAPLRETAIRQFRGFGLPTIKDEEFRYLDFRPIARTEWQAAYGSTLSRAQVEPLPLGDLDAPNLTFVNGEFAPELSRLDALPAGIRFGSLAEAIDEDPEAVLTLLGHLATLSGRLGSTNDERFTHLNTAFLADGAYVRVERGVELEVPLHVRFIQRADHGPLAAHPRLLLHLEPGATAKLVESYVGMAGSYLVNPVAEIELEECARLEHVRLQADSPGAFHIGAAYVRQARQSTYTSTVANFGADMHRHDLNVAVDGEYAETWLNGANVANGAQVMDNHTRLDHAQPNCVSFENYKTVLNDEARGVFNGKIFVYQDAQKTDAKQTNQALLLSPRAQMDTKPQLEIFADDVKCTHGATIGRLRDDARFYLMSRGIPRPEADALLVYAFTAEALERVSLPTVRAVLENALFDKLRKT
jgi:Fe-S cluster assembly protein SufD